jgi:hypothetical protein
MSWIASCSQSTVSRRWFNPSASRIADRRDSLFRNIPRLFTRRRCERIFVFGRACHPEMTALIQSLSDVAGMVRAPSPSASCIITVSSQRPNLKPTSGWVPII